MTYLSTPFISVILMGFLWKRSNRAAGLFGVVGGLIIQLAVALGLPEMGISLHWLYVAFIAQCMIMLGMVVVALVTTPPSPAEWEPFLWTPALLKNIDGAEGRPWYHGLRFWGAVFVLIWGFLYWRFW